MIFKIVRSNTLARGVSDSQGNIKQKVVPYENFVWEAKKAKYHKVNVGTLNDFERCVPENCHVVYPPLPPQNSKAREEEGIEYIELRLNNNEQTVICADCSLYIMNDQGKTIDSIHCYSS